MMGGEENFLRAYEEATSAKYGFLLSDFRSMKMYKWGAELTEPIEVYSRYDENGNINKTVDPKSNDDTNEPLKPKCQ